ncbi:MAG: CBASS cGAMP-activated phospholipase [Alphaproteobacteria bacterium]
MSNKPFRVLSLDGGGMRGIYSAIYLKKLADSCAKNKGFKTLDIGKAFDLIVGTSTGGILACALAFGAPLSKVIELYRNEGPRIFQSQLPSGINVELGRQLLMRPIELRSGAQALKRALSHVFLGETMESLYERRKIALAIPSVNMHTHSAWVFKTPHLLGNNGRDNKYTLVDVCLATSAAPIFRSLEAIEEPGGYGTYHVFTDGGLWANNPVLVALLEALRMTEHGRSIEIFSLGTCPKPVGENLSKEEVNRGLLEWKFGGKISELSIDAQEFAYDHMARMFAGAINRPCNILRFPTANIPPDDIKFLNLDETSKEGLEALTRLALRDADIANSKIQDPKSEEGAMIKRLFDDMPKSEKPKPYGLAVECNS